MFLVLGNGSLVLLPFSGNTKKRQKIDSAKALTVFEGENSTQKKSLASETFYVSLV